MISTSIHYNVQYVVFTVGYILHLNDNLALCNDTYCHETVFCVRKITFSFTVYKDIYYLLVFNLKISRPMRTQLVADL